MLTTTCTELLQGLLDEDHAAWREFDERYRPVLFAFARRAGLGEEDAADATQETLVAFSSQYKQGTYERQRGRLKGWLFAIARRRIVDSLRKLGRETGRRGDSVLDELQDSDALNESWEEEWRQAVLQRGLAELRTGTNSDEDTIRAFEMLCFEEKSPARVARELGMTTNNVYTAKHRALARLRSILERIEVDF